MPTIKLFACWFAAIYVACLWTGVCAVHAGETSDEEAVYQSAVKSVLKARCFACHGALRHEAGLRLDTAELMRRGGESGTALVARDSASSLIVKRVMAGQGERMPPEGEALTPEQIADLRKWIDSGASAPSDEVPERDPSGHWAFKAPVRPDLPKATQQAITQNAIDSFLEQRRTQFGLRRQGQADSRILVRRVFLDLVGLPPTRQQSDAFVNDSSPTAYESVVDRLLSSPEYGERWGRHWMDIWRYSDWWGLGADARNSHKHIWHFRDWIIESLNHDKGYDQMLREMLAADELYPNDLDRLRGAGFLARQYFKFNRTSWLDEVIEHTSKAMLGMTFNCAKCHDHKYDPIRQDEYYQLRAIFEPHQIRLDMVPGQVDFERDGIPRSFDCNLDAKTYLHLRGDDRNPDKSRELQPGIPEFLSLGDWKVEPIALPPQAYQPHLRPFVATSHIDTARQRLDQARRAHSQARESANQTPADSSKSNIERLERLELIAQAEFESVSARAQADEARSENLDRADELARLAARLERLAAVRVAESELAMANAELEKPSKGKEDAAMARAKKAGESLEKAKRSAEKEDADYTSLAGSLKTPESNLETEESRRKPFPATSTGRRTALAKWMTDARNPLVARVAINHIWLRHFGKPLVPAVFNFGLNGEPPTHPELLDWLAVELMENNWSMKHIHRLMVTSQAYRLSSATESTVAENLEKDPENRYYWRSNFRRMEAQVVRDSLLSLAHELDHAQGGPSIPIKDIVSRRKSLYFVHSHNEHHQFLSTYDDANVLECYRRAESIVPQQALALENSQLVVDASRTVADRIAELPNMQSADRFIEEAFLTVLGTGPSHDEMRIALEGLTALASAAHKQGRPAPEQSARQQLVLSLFNLNDFVTIR